MYSALHPLLALALLVSAADPSKSDPAAEKLMKDAHLARASWDKTFPGFSAKLIAVLDGKEVDGKLTVTSAGKVKVELADAPITEWATKQLESIVGHRFENPREKYEVSFAEPESKHPLGRLIRFEGTHNLYRIKGDVITEVNRSMGKGKFTISITEVVRTSENKYLPRSFNVSRWDESGALVGNDDYTEDYVRIGKYDLPKRRLHIKTGKDQRTVGELRLSDHQLSAGSASK